jgi:DNA polymerase III alpha subunit
MKAANPKLAQFKGVPDGHTPESFFRHLVFEGLAKRYPSPTVTWDQAVERAEFEIGELISISAEGVYDFVGYTLVVWDIYNFCRREGILAGPGRGCLSDKAKVWTPGGTKSIGDVVNGDFVYTHEGRVQKVLNTFAYDIDEPLVSISVYYGGADTIELTADHKVLVKRRGPAAPEWLEACLVSEGDFVCVPRPPSPATVAYRPYNLFQADQLSVLNKRQFLVDLWDFTGKRGEDEWTLLSDSREHVDRIRRLLWAVGAPAGLEEVPLLDAKPTWKITTTPYFAAPKPQFGAVDDDFVYMRVRSIGAVEDVRKVYDFQVEDDHSYMTDSFMVHNSVAGSICSYALTISDVCPIENDLLFARYVTKFRVSPPDIDMDFQASARLRVVKYVQDTYGEDMVALIGLKTRFQPKSAINTATKGFHPTNPGLAKAIAAEINSTMPEPVAGFPMPLADNPKKKELGLLNPANEAGEAFRKMAKKYPEIVDSAVRMIGVNKSVGLHACGVVISTEPLVGRIPVRYDHPRQCWATEIDGKEVEDDGYQKFDFLSAIALDVEAAAVKFIKQFYATDIDVERIVLDDAVLALLQTGDTVGVFQVESRPMMELLRSLRPTEFADISAVLALFRPGPLAAGMHTLFADRKNGRAKIDYTLYGARTAAERAALDQVLGKTYLTMVMQEQSMLLGKVIAGFGEELMDMLRYGLAKKDQEKVLKVGKLFVGQGVKEWNGTPAFSQNFVETVWKMIEGGSKYLFNACLTGDTVVQTGNGLSLTIADLSRAESYAGVNLLALSANGSIEAKPMVTVHANGVQNTWTLSLADGKSITSTSDHRHMTPSGWVETHDLYVGDSLVVANDDMTSSSSEIVSIDFAGPQMTYDVEMEDEMHCFVANGIVTHNSHTAAYAVTTVRTAWLKAHYRMAFSAASLNLYDGYRRQLMIADVRDSGHTVLPPLLNTAVSTCVPVPDRDAVMLGFDGIRNVGAFAERIMAAREQDGPYSSLNDLWARHATVKVDTEAAKAILDRVGVEIPSWFDWKNADAVEALVLDLAEGDVPEADVEEFKTVLEKSQGMNTRVLGALIQAGVCDEFGPRLGQMMVMELAKEGLVQAIPPVEWPELEKLERERFHLDAYASNHPLTYAADDIASFLRTRKKVLSVEGLLEAAAQTEKDEMAVAVYGVITDMKIEVNKKGNRQMKFTLQGETTSLLGTAFHTVLDSLENLKPGTIVACEGVARISRPEAGDDDGLDSEGNVIASDDNGGPSDIRVFLQLAWKDSHHATPIPVRIVRPDLSDGKTLADISGKLLSRGQFKNGVWKRSPSAPDFTPEEQEDLALLNRTFGGQSKGFGVLRCAVCGMFTMSGKSAGKDCTLTVDCGGQLRRYTKLRRDRTKDEYVSELRSRSVRPVTQLSVGKDTAPAALTSLSSPGVLFGGTVSATRHSAKHGSSFLIDHAPAGFCVQFTGERTAVRVGDWVVFTVTEPVVSPIAVISPSSLPQIASWGFSSLEILASRVEVDA